MEDREQIIFKTQMRGFDKKAVLEYIDQLTDSARTKEKEYQVRLEDAENKNALFSAEINDLRLENERLAAENEELRLNAAQLEEQTESMTAEKLAARERDNEILKERVTSLNEEILRLKTQLAQKEENIRKLMAESDILINQQSELSEKGMKYDQISSSVGAVVLEAQRTADAIIANANHEAQAKRDDADAALVRVNEHLNHFHEEIAKIQTAMFHTMESFENSMNEMKEAVNHAGILLNGEENPQELT